MDKATVQRRFQEAAQLHQAGALERAEKIYRALLSDQPNHPNALHLLGVLCLRTERASEAVELINRAIRLMPNSAAYYNNLGSALRSAGKAREAETAFRRAAELDPRLAQAHFNLGLALFDRREIHHAISCYRRAIELKADYAQAYNNLGAALQVLSRHEEAIASQRAAVALRPDEAELHNNLGVALRAGGKIEESIVSLRQAVALRPNYSSAYANLADACLLQGRVGEGVKLLRDVVPLSPDNRAMGSHLLLALHYEPYDPQQLFIEHRRWAQRLPWRASSVHNNDPVPWRRLRIGYVSPDFRRHSVNYFIEPVLASHDREAFEVICYADELWPDKTTDRLRPMAQRWRNIAHHPDESVAQMIRDDAVDILIDLSGHTGSNRLSVFARKPAPLQVTYLGYADTTGLEAMDYRLTDAVADPPGQTDRWHTEKLVRLTRGAWCYRPPDEAPEPGAAPLLSADGVRFGSFNILAKFSEPVVAAWSAILRQVPRARLVLKTKALDDAAARNLICERFAREGIDAERLELLGHTKSYLDHLLLYRKIDIVLDPFPYNGTTTTCEALWMGLPVITLAGETHVTRVGASLLNRIGLDDLVTHNLDEYVRRSIDLAGDVTRLDSLRQTMRQRMRTSPLMDEHGFTRELEHAYRQMWQAWCIGRC